MLTGHDNVKGFRILCKIIFGMICLTGMIYQTSNLVSVYMKGKTIVNLEIGFIFNDTLPAITLCYPFALSIKKSAEINESYR